MHQIKLSARLPDQSIAPRHFAPFQLRERAMDANHEHIAVSQCFSPIIPQNFFEHNLVQNHP